MNGGWWPAPSVLLPTAITSVFLPGHPLDTLEHLAWSSSPTAVLVRDYERNSEGPRRGLWICVPGVRASAGIGALADVEVPDCLH